MTTTTVCNTIPALFPLYRAIRQGSSDDSRSYGDQVKGSHGRHRSNLEAYPMNWSRRKNAAEASVVIPENKSDESILGSTRRADHNGVIQCTQEYTVEYSSQA
jgi:hypothetical protein